MSDAENPAHDVTEPSSSVADAGVSTSLPAEAVNKPGHRQHHALSTPTPDAPILIDGPPANAREGGSGAPLDLDALSALCEAATPGPWRNDHSELHAINLHPSWRTTWSGDGSGFGEVTRSHDAAFIAAARTAMPALIERVRKAEHERDELRSAVERVRAIRRARAWHDSRVCGGRYNVERLYHSPACNAYADGIEDALAALDSQPEPPQTEAPE